MAGEDENKKAREAHAALNGKADAVTVANFAKPKTTVKQPPKWLVVLGLVVLVVATGFGLYQKRQNSIPSGGSACTVKMLKEAAPSLYGDKNQELKSLVTKIEALPLYTTDPNCLNIVATYYIHTTDYENAQKALNSLNKAYDPAKGFSKHLGDKALTMSYIQDNVLFLKKQAENFSKNHELGPEVQ